MPDLMGIRTLVLGYTVHQQKNVTLQHQYIVYKLLRNTLIIWPPPPSTWSSEQVSKDLSAKNGDAEML